MVNCSQKRCWLKDLVLTVTGAFGNLINVWPFSPAAADTVTKRYDATYKTRLQDEGVRGKVSMIKSELIAKLAEANPHLYQRDVERIVSTIFDEIAAALARGDRVELRGFGAFSVKTRPARVGCNPRTGETVHVAQKFVPYFKTGKDLRERLNANGTALPG